MPTDHSDRLPRSPYERALGSAFAGLHPKLLTYFSAIPAGAVGSGAGVFDVVGTPRRWLWPVLWILGRAGIVFPVCEHDVPFTVINRPTTDATGEPAVRAVRRFRFDGGDREMVDVISAGPAGLSDRLGRGGLISATFAATVADRGLALRSDRIRVHLGAITVGLPAALSPVVRLSERFDDATGLQRVTVTIDVSLIGRVYEYSGSFGYSVNSGGEPS
ncbi:hypothetical protein IWX78_001000 [Mycetocola sp. CAN_C7]|uniref:DUF4166 domain-containing protein n=1 Tax=Mycetocola sp. CAN_C7 TaxID=2787724 RepID=UPI001A2429D5